MSPLQSNRLILALVFWLAIACIRIVECGWRLGETALQRDRMERALDAETRRADSWAKRCGEVEP